MLQRQIVPATKHLGTRSSGRQNVDTKKLKFRVKKCSPSDNKENIKKFYLKMLSLLRRGRHFLTRILNFLVSTF